MNYTNFEEIFIVNGIGVALLLFLRLIRIENGKKRLLDDKLYDLMIWITIGGCIVETLTFVVDGQIFPGCIPISYLLNSLCFIGTCSVGFLWCLFVDFRVYHSMSRIKKRVKILVLPLALDILLNLINLNGCGILFTISKDNVYSRGTLAVLVYVIVFGYCTYSLCFISGLKKSVLHTNFISVHYFVIPCMVGTVIQGLVYGISIGWTSIAIAFVLVYMQAQSQIIFVDSLSGLYNRRYMDCVLRKLEKDFRYRMYGIMIDVNGFKQINDRYGHSKGDSAIRNVGVILSDSVPEEGIAIRYAGDEFILLLCTDDETIVKETMDLVEQKVEHFNKTSKEPYKLSFAMGYSRFEHLDEGVEQFLSAMDAKMYEAKRKYYTQKGVDRRR